MDVLSNKKEEQKELGKDFDCTSLLPSVLSCKACGGMLIWLDFKWKTGGVTGQNWATCLCNSLADAMTWVGREFLSTVAWRISESIQGMQYSFCSPVKEINLNTLVFISNSFQMCWNSIENREGWICVFKAWSLSGEHYVNTGKPDVPICGHQQTFVI